METREQILKRSFSTEFICKVRETSDIIGALDTTNEFIERMQNAIELSHYKYGWPSKTYPELAIAWKCAEQRIYKYRETHNLEYLVDVANFLMLEYMFPYNKEKAVTYMDIYPSICDANDRYIDKCENLINAYKESNDMNHLICACSMVLFEYNVPMYMDAFYKSEDSDKSCGLAGGISYKQLMSEE